MDINKLGNYCKQYRIETLKLSLTDFSNKVNENLKNVNAFEGGRANNIKYLTYYYNLSDEKQKDDFLEKLFNIL